MTGKPTPLPVSPGAIPAALQARDAWLLWRYEQRQGKWTKVPVNARTGNHASSTNPETWTDYATALAAYQGGRHRADGIGIALSGGLTALDFDACVGDAGDVAPDVMADLVQLRTYAERSPSGAGVRAFVFADLPPDGGNRRGKVEAYCGDRFVTVTGHALDGVPATVCADADALAAWHAHRIGPRLRRQERTSRPAPATTLPGADADIIRRGMTVPAFVALYERGDLSRHDGDASRADMALCCHLVYLHADPGQVDRIFRTSALMRDKWQRDDYREATIALAFDRTTDRWRELGDAPRSPGQTAPDADAGTADVADPETLRARVIDLQRERDRITAERDRAAAERDHANQTIAGMRAILANGELGATRIIALAAYAKLDAVTRNHEAGVPDDGMFRLTAGEIGEVVGLDSATASRHLRALEQIPGSPLRRELRTIEERDADGLVTGGRQWTFLGMTTPTALDFAAAVSQLHKPGTRHGGTRQRRTIDLPPIPACADHPDAGAIVALAAYCAEPGCGQELAQWRTRLDADELATVIDAPSRVADADCILQSGVPPIAADVAVTTTRQDAIGPAADAADTDAGDAGCIMQTGVPAVEPAPTPEPRPRRGGALMTRMERRLGIGDPADPTALDGAGLPVYGQPIPDTPEQERYDQREAEADRADLSARVAAAVQAATDVPDILSGVPPGLPLVPDVPTGTHGTDRWTA